MPRDYSVPLRGKHIPESIVRPIRDGGRERPVSAQIIVYDAYSGKLGQQALFPVFFI